MGTILFFEGDSAELDGKARDELKQVLPLLMGKRQKIELRGHARRLAAAAAGKTDVWQLSYTSVARRR